jgi:tRNA dimethylallyltransferase
VTQDLTRSEGPAGARPPVVVLAGPTASGKSALALDLAEAFAGVIVNADAMQVYRELEILTARPDAGALARAPHRLYGVLPGAEACSAGRWREMALARGLAPLPRVPAGLRRAARQRHRELGGAAFHAALAARDPATAARLEPGDSQRLIRAWEVLEATGRPLAEWQAADSGADTPYRFLCIALLPPREALYAACDRRFLGMVEAGALDEVRALLALGLDPELPVMKALGVPELAAHLNAALPLETAVARAQQATRRYGKRQMTWLRTQLPRDFSGNQVSLAAFQAQYSESLRGEIFTIIRDFVLTPQK